MAFEEASRFEARFDSLAPGGETRGIRFHDLRRVVTAWTLDEVVARIGEVEAEVGAGAHAAGYVAYEAAPAMDPALAAATERADLPLLCFGIFGTRREGPALADVAEDPAGYRIGDLEPSLSREAYERGAAEILRLIAAGDSYQVNFTFRLRGAFDGSATALYRDLCRAQRSDFCALLDLGTHAVVSASPELFFHQRDRHLRMRPMKGTRPRGRWSEEDDRLAAELVASAKDRAENLMIVDLLRNDLGRIAEFGTVEVTRLFEVERYPTVHQLTSTVEGRLRESVRLADVFRALFPSGSVTGAPKIRTCEIIRDLESSPRGVYTGAIGFLSPGETVFSVAIRTAIVDRSRRRLEMGVGSGITADSDPAAEYRESMSKGTFLRFTPPDFQLLESLRLDLPGRYLLLDGHLERLEATARYFAFPFDRRTAAERLDERAAALPPGSYKVRLLVDRDGLTTIEHEAIPRDLPTARVRLADRPVVETDPFLFHKTTNRVAYGEALHAGGGVDDVIFFNRRGELTESSTANLVLDLDGQLLTPPLESGLLAGVMRAELLRRGEIREAVLTADDLRRANRILLVNSVRGWREATLA